MSKTNSIASLVTTLALISGTSAALLGGVSLLTREPIARRLQEKTGGALSDVLPAFDNDPLQEKVETGNVTFYIGRKNNRVTGFAGETISPEGYNGNITVLAGLQPNGKITAVLVTSQAETPGLGTVVCERSRQKAVSSLGKHISGLPPNAILDQFSGMKANPGDKPWQVKKDGGKLDAVSGATITSRAVSSAVYAIARSFMENSEQLMKETF